MFVRCLSLVSAMLGCCGVGRLFLSRSDPPHSAPARLCAQLSPLFLGYNGAKWHLAVERPQLPSQFCVRHRAGWYPDLIVRLAAGGMAPPSLLLSPL